MKYINWCIHHRYTVALETVHRPQQPSHTPSVTIGHTIDLSWRLVAIVSAYTIVDSGMEVIIEFNLR